MKLVELGPHSNMSSEECLTLCARNHQEYALRSLALATIGDTPAFLANIGNSTVFIGALPDLTAN